MTPAPALAPPARPAAPPVATARPTAVPPTGPRVHTIAVGDTLSQISLRYYGTTSRWTDILAANRDLLRDEKSLIAGRILRLP